MNVVEYVLDGLEKALELERELGVKSVECDRELIACDQPAPSPSSAVAPSPSSPPPVAPSAGPFDFVFIHDRALSEAGISIMTKIITALGKTPETAPIIIARPVPKARIYIILGSRALKKFMPDLKGEPGQWIKSPRGNDVLITYSPEYFLRFDSVTPVVEKHKQAMWRSLKAVKQRINL